MRPLYHPPVSEITVEGILYALSDPVRMQIFLQLVQSSECGLNCSKFIQLGTTELPKSTLSQHFKILRESGLIRSERKGVELQNYTRCAELKKPFGAMIDAIVHAYVREQKR
jgi:DNA-binding transcriptional ArsR family regulator